MSKIVSYLVYLSVMFRKTFIIHIFSIIFSYRYIISFLDFPRYGAFGLVISGPVLHLFYLWLDKTIPPKGNEAMVKRLLCERLVFSPIFMAIFHVAMAGMEVSLHNWCNNAKSTSAWSFTMNQIHPFLTFTVSKQRRNYKSIKSSLLGNSRHELEILDNIAVNQC